MFMRAAAAVQVILGIGFWTGRWAALVNIHMLIGVLFVLALWALAGVALSQRHIVGLAVFAFVWGLVLAGFGMTQRGIMVGDMHWVIRVLHLVIALAAMPIAERLAAARAATAVA
jgi:hypothetical protein